jgi:hypothetical protein
MYRYEVPIDDGMYTYGLGHNPVAVAVVPDDDRERDVEFWAEHTEGAPLVKRTFRVFGTGQPLPNGAKWIGTCPRTAAGLVWHLYALEGGGE